MAVSVSVRVALDYLADRVQEAESQNTGKASQQDQFEILAEIVFPHSSKDERQLMAACCVAICES